MSLHMSYFLLSTEALRVAIQRNGPGTDPNGVQRPCDIVNWIYNQYTYTGTFYATFDVTPLMIIS